MFFSFCEKHTEHSSRIKHHRKCQAQSWSPAPLESKKASLESDVSALSSEGSTLESSVSSLEADVTDLQAKSGGMTNYAIGGVIGLIIGAIAVYFLTKQS
ncbi:hypothetical protein ISS39_02090 [Candidatus Bathyarchaeota archaeon]|nr:hypothetical protein [Candidatus Bathyarchaeota archaeon]